MNSSDHLLAQIAASDPASQAQSLADDEVFRRVERHLARATAVRPFRARAAVGQQMVRRLALPALVLGVTLAILGIGVAASGRHRASSSGAGRPGSSPAQKLADGTVNCIRAQSGQAPLQPSEYHGMRVLGSSLDGQRPTAFCRKALTGVNGRETAAGRSIALIACEANPTTVDVYLASGASDQCQAIGEKPMPVGFVVAEARVRALVEDLKRIGTSHNCIARNALARDIQSTLDRLGLHGWKLPRPTVSQSHGYAIPAGTGGTCGDASLDTQQQKIFLTLVPSRSVQRELQHVSYELYHKSYEDCYTASTVRTLVAGWFANVGMATRFATVSRQKGTHYEPASERRYLDGCVRFNSAWTGNNNTFVDVELVAKGAPQLPAGQFFPPARDFAP